MAKRKLGEEDVLEALEKGEEEYAQMNGRFGLKHITRIKVAERYMIVVWFVNKMGEKEVATVYWRRL